MRIISGLYKGRRITPPKNLPVRPTTDMSKEAVFNVLHNHFNFSDLRILELFAGTGSISYEFASRGAKPILSIDADRGCVDFIKRTANEFEMDITVLRSNVFTFLEKHRGEYDIIFADPPYGMSQQDFEKIVQLVTTNQLLDSEGMLVIEHSKYTSMDHLPFFSFQKNYGGSFFSFFEWSTNEEE